MALSDFDTLLSTYPTVPTPVATSSVDTTANPSVDTTATTMGQTPYERDYLPAQRTYFKQLMGDSKMNPTLAANLMNQDTAMAQKAYVQRTAIEQAGMDLKARQMQFESAKFTLDQAREDAARKRNMFTGLSQLQSELNPIMADPNLDSSQRKQAYGQLGVKYAGQAALNPAIANALNAANSSLTTQQKDRVTKLDYFNAGAHPDVLASYEKSIGRSLAANEDVPIDVYGTGLYTAKTGEINRRSNLEAEKEKQDRFGKVFDFVAKAKTKENKLNPMGPATEYDDPISKNAVTSVVEEFGTPDEIKKFGKANVTEQIGIGQSIVSDIYLGKRAAAPPKPTRSSFRSGFTSPK
jgi:hypothetical protein